MGECSQGLYVSCSIKQSGTYQDQYILANPLELPRHSPASALRVRGGGLMNLQRCYCPAALESNFSPYNPSHALIITKARYSRTHRFHVPYFHHLNHNQLQSQPSHTLLSPTVSPLPKSNSSSLCPLSFTPRAYSLHPPLIPPPYPALPPLPFPTVRIYLPSIHE